jgi:DmsE family decaheme c-type cytochrome
MRRILAYATAVVGALLLWTLVPAAYAQTGAQHACIKCHESAVTGMQRGKHHDPADLSGKSCASCHGDVSAHAADPRKNKMANVFGKKVPAAQKDQSCLSCHDGNRMLAFWDAGKHKKNDVACSNCHNIHGKAGEPSVGRFVTTARQLEYETCNSCHKQTRAQINKTSHHPIVEGKVTCSDCHNPHGALSHAMVKNESVNQLCISCHADKRGPFVWEHAPVEENCLSCHNSHGSNHPKLLNEKVPNLCQDCHDAARHPGTPYGSQASFGAAAPSGVNTRFIARSCVNCHQTIHGSNAPGNRGKYFTR